jgi:hypothetical protein
MSFTPISKQDYIKMHLKSNPRENEKDLIKRLDEALEDFKNGVKCACGSAIWVLGSASMGNSCFRCIAGESESTDDYEIDEAIKKRDDTKRGRHIDDIPRDQIFGFFDDDGYEVNMNLIKKPTLCLSCRKNTQPREEMVCNLRRMDQTEGEEFECFAYEQI